MEHLNRARRNALLTYGIYGFENASATLPIWLLFFTRQLGFSVTAGVTLMMSRWFVMALCSIPTGAWADRYGRAKIYRIGQFLYAVSYIPFLLTNNYLLLLAVQIFGGFVGSMSIGSLEPIVKDSYSLAQLPDQKYTNFLSNKTIVLYFTRLGAGILGAWIYVSHPYGPYYVEITMLSLAWLLSLFLQDRFMEKATAQTNREHIAEALRYVWRHRYLRDYFITVLLTVLVTEGVWIGLQPIFVVRAIDPKFFGLLFGMIALFSAAGAYWSRRIADRVNGISIKLNMVYAIIFGTALMIINAKWAVLAAIIPMAVAFGFIDPIDHYTIQKHTSPKHQATVLSLRDLLNTGFLSIVAVIVGRYVDLYGTNTMIKILFFQTIVCATAITIVLKYNESAANSEVV